MRAREFSRSLAPSVPCSLFLADARQLLADHGGNYAVGAHGGARHQHVLVLRGHVADARGVFAQRMRAQEFPARDRRLRARRRKPPCLRWPRTRDRGRATRTRIALRAAPGMRLSSIAMPTLEDCAISFSVEARPPRVGSRMAWTCAPAASSTSAIMPFSAAQSRPDLALELEALAHAHDGHAVVADGSRDEDRVAGLACDADPRRCPVAGGRRPQW